MHSRELPKYPHGHGFIEATSIKFDGKVRLVAAREIVTCLSSIGWRKTSKTLRSNSGSSSKNKTPRCASELAKDWRQDKYLRRLEAMMAVADKNVSFVLTGSGDVLEPEDGLIGIGSGGSFALSAARALIDIDGLTAEQIAKKAMKIAADICIYTNNNVIFEKL